MPIRLVWLVGEFPVLQRWIISNGCDGSEEITARGISDSERPSRFAVGVAAARSLSLSTLFFYL